MRIGHSFDCLIVYDIHLIVYDIHFIVHLIVRTLVGMRAISSLDGKALPWLNRFGFIFCCCFFFFFFFWEGGGGEDLSEK